MARRGAAAASWRQGPRSCAGSGAGAARRGLHGEPSGPRAGSGSPLPDGERRRGQPGGPVTTGPLPSGRGSGAGARVELDRAVAPGLWARTLTRFAGSWAVPEHRPAGKTPTSWWHQACPQRFGSRKTGAVLCGLRAAGTQDGNGGGPGGVGRGGGGVAGKGVPSRRWGLIRPLLSYLFSAGPWEGLAAGLGGRGGREGRRA